jgi:hypothetical protein
MFFLGSAETTAGIDAEQLIASAHKHLHVRKDPLLLTTDDGTAQKQQRSALVSPDAAEYPCPAKEEAIALLVREYNVLAQRIGEQSLQMTDLATLGSRLFLAQGQQTAQQQQLDATTVEIVAQKELDTTTIGAYSQDSTGNNLAPSYFTILALSGVAVLVMAILLMALMARRKKQRKTATASATPDAKKRPRK